jgi:hypothetical protein
VVGRRFRSRFGLRFAEAYGFESAIIHPFRRDRKSQCPHLNRLPRPTPMPSLPVRVGLACARVSPSGRDAKRRRQVAGVLGIRAGERTQVGVSWESGRDTVREAPGQGEIAPRSSRSVKNQLSPSSASNCRRASIQSELASPGIARRSRCSEMK